MWQHLKNQLRPVLRVVVIGAFGLLIVYVVIAQLLSTSAPATIPKAGTIATLGAPGGFSTTGYWMIVLLLVLAVILPSLTAKVPGVLRTIALVALVGFLLFGARTPQVLEKVQSGMSSAILDAPTTTPSGTPTASAKWAQTADDGSIPVGVWSESTMLPPGSMTYYDAGNGTVYQIRYRLYGGKWTIHPGGNNFPPANEIQFRALKGSLTKIPFTVKQP
ncbi:MAG: hypothetical protein WAW13_02840 [Minisyncoccia bacterium]